MKLLESSIKAELAARGIECRGNHNGCKELFRDGLSLGWFRVDAAVRKFIPEFVR